MGELAGRVALVTGASRGIGLATAGALAAEGVAVMLAARSADAIGAEAARLGANGAQAAARACDVSRWEEVEAAVAATVAAFGRLDILVNNAGVIEPIARLGDSEPEGWAHAFDINAKGVYFGIRAALPVMLAQGGGLIVNISSGAATSPLEGWSHYCASKAAALMLTRATHLEYADRGIRVVGLSPGTVATRMQREIRASGVNPVSRIDWEAHIPPEWPARAIVWLCTEAARAHDGGDVSLRDPAIRARLGLG